MPRLSDSSICWRNSTAKRRNHPHRILRARPSCGDRLQHHLCRDCCRTCRSDGGNVRGYREPRRVHGIDFTGVATCHHAKHCRPTGAGIEASRALSDILRRQKSARKFSGLIATVLLAGVTGAGAPAEAANPQPGKRLALLKPSHLEKTLLNVVGISADLAETRPGDFLP